VSVLIDAVERGRVPDRLVRAGIRRLLARRLRREGRGGVEARAARLMALVGIMCRSPVAVAADSANEQHYEVPADFFEILLGPRLKYSACLWHDGVHTLADAEAAMLELTCERADLADGQQVLELGCGWGSLTLWMAEHFPASRITALSNSASQAAFIRRRAEERGIRNVEVVTADVAAFDPGARFDRIVSVEMFEHMRNWETLFGRVAGWLEPGGRFFMHVFCHRELAYFFETEGAGNWMGRHFFTGGLMPADALPLYFQRDLSVEAHWRVGGRHYARTCRAWLRRLDEARERAAAVLGGRREVGRWRLFLMACEELFAWNGGDEWFVAHYRFVRRSGIDA